MGLHLVDYISGSYPQPTWQRTLDLWIVLDINLDMSARSTLSQCPAFTILGC